MDTTGISFSGASLSPLASGGLWWQQERTLVVSDLHMGKSERIARRAGTLLPPYDTEETLARLAADIAAHDPRRVICLGDSFDDDLAARDLAPAHRETLATLMAGRTWVWIEGNHDPAAPPFGGEAMAELHLGALVFRHIAHDGPVEGEVSGHWHPKASLMLRHRKLTSPCFVMDGHRLILPAFGAYTGGLAVSNPAIRGLMGPDAAVILTRAPGHAIPMARACA